MHANLKRYQLFLLVISCFILQACNGALFGESDELLTENDKLKYAAMTIRCSGFENGSKLSCVPGLNASKTDDRDNPNYVSNWSTNKRQTPWNPNHEHDDYTITALTPIHSK